MSEGDRQPQEHRVVLVVHSGLKYFEVMSALVASARELFPGPVEAFGYDLKKATAELRDVTRERNTAVQEAHRLRCELEKLKR